MSAMAQFSRRGPPAGFYGAFGGYRLTFWSKRAKAPCFLRRPVMQRWADFIDGKAETGKVVKIGGGKR